MPFFGTVHAILLDSTCHTSGQYMPYFRNGEGWDGLWFCGNISCGAGNLSKSNQEVSEVLYSLHTVEDSGHSIV